MVDGGGGCSLARVAGGSVQAPPAHRPAAQNGTRAAGMEQAPRRARSRSGGAAQGARRARAARAGRQRGRHCGLIPAGPAHQGVSLHRLLPVEAPALLLQTRLDRDAHRALCLCAIPARFAHVQLGFLALLCFVCVSFTAGHFDRTLSFARELFVRDEATRSGSIDPATTASCKGAITSTEFGLQARSRCNAPVPRASTCRDERGTTLTKSTRHLTLGVQ